MERILIIKLSALGDFVMTVGAMRHAAEQHPGAHVTLLTTKPFVGMAEQMGVFSDYIIDTRKTKDSPRIVRAIAQGRFNRIYDFQANDRIRSYRRLLRLVAAPGSWDWVDAPHRLLYHVEKRFPLGIGRQSVKAHEQPWPQSDISFLRGEGKHLDELPERYVLLIPGCSPQHPYKRWPVANYRSIVQRLAERGIQAVVIGTQAEADVINGICEGQPSAVNMMGRTGLLDVPQIALRSLAAVGNDTGPTHMAALSRTLTITLFDNRTRSSVLHVPTARSFVSDSTIDLISVDQVWETLLPQLG